MRANERIDSKLRARFIRCCVLSRCSGQWPYREHSLAEQRCYRSPRWDRPASATFFEFSVLIGDKQAIKKVNLNMQNGETTSTPLFNTIGHSAEQVDNLANGDEESQKLVEEIESMCINCEENVIPSTSQNTDSQGTTRLLLTKIPFFREVILMSFSCPHCGISPLYLSVFLTVQASPTRKYKMQDKFNLVDQNTFSKSLHSKT